MMKSTGCSDYILELQYFCSRDRSSIGARPLCTGIWLCQQVGKVPVERRVNLTNFSGQILYLHMSCVVLVETVHFSRQELAESTLFIYLIAFLAHHSV